MINSKVLTNQIHQTNYDFLLHQHHSHLILVKAFFKLTYLQNLLLLLTNLQGCPILLITFILIIQNPSSLVLIFHSMVFYQSYIHKQLLLMQKSQPNIHDFFYKGLQVPYNQGYLKYPKHFLPSILLQLPYQLASNILSNRIPNFQVLNLDEEFFLNECIPMKLLYKLKKILVI